MSRITTVLVALLAIAILAAPAFAEDRLSLAGSLQVRGYFAQQDDGTNDRSSAWNDMRMRIGGKLAVAEGVSVNFRFDTSESDENSSDAVAWGGSTAQSYAPYSQRRADIQFDKAYLQLEKGGYTFTAGQQYFGMGTGHIVDTVGAGFMIKRAGLTLLHVKQYDANNGNDSFTKTGFDETSLTAAQYVIKTDAFTLTPMVSYTAAQSTDVQRLGLGLNFSANLGVVGLKGELDYFNGENAATADEKGLQLYLDASTAVSDTVTLGAMILYAQSQDGGDVQVTYQAMPVFGGWSPLTYGFNSTDFVLDYGSELNPYAIDTNAGMQAVQLYTDVKVSDDLKLKAAAAYAQSDDDDVSDIDGYILNAGLSYAVMANTTLTTSLNYSSFDDNGADLDTIQAITGLYVKF
jgi:hypothetical protein